MFTSQQLDQLINATRAALAANDSNAITAIKRALPPGVARRVEGNAWANAGQRMASGVIKTGPEEQAEQEQEIEEGGGMDALHARQVAQALLQTFEQLKREL